MKSIIEKQKRKVQKGIDAKIIAAQQQWPIEYVQRVLKVQSGIRHGDQKEVIILTGLSHEHVSRTVKLKVLNETVIEILERIIAQRTERLKDAPLYKKHN